MQEIKTALKKYFGFAELRPGQEEIISSILGGDQVIAVLPTGAGKSLCYQIPALISDNFSIVISPLIALMKDQVDSLNRKNEVAAFINSTMSIGESEEVLRKISFGKIKILYLAPERLENKSFAERINRLSPNFLFIDEAHCISEWGHNFRPSYTKINEFIEFCLLSKVSAFTATATPEVIKDISTQLNFKDPKIFVKGFERDNLYLNVQLNVKKKNKLLELLTGIKGAAIIYTSSRKKAEEAAEFLTTKGIKCGYYHAGLRPIERRKVQDDFINNELYVICATNAFGMGIDKKNIRLLIHYNMPASIENYYQEIGRAGRDGVNSDVYLLYDDKDINIQNFFISNSHPTKEFIQSIYNAINDYNQVAINSLPATELIINQEYISNYTGININKGLLYASLKFLENAGYIKRVSEFEKKDTIQIILGKNRLEEFVRGTPGAEIKNSILILLREFGSEILSGHKQISITHLSELLGIEKENLYESLTTLDNLGVISFHPSIEKETIILTAPRVEKERLRLNYKKINEGYLNSKQKLDKMIEYVFTNECRFKFILSYFGEDVENYKCGRCDNCTDTDKIPDKAFDYISELILKTISEAATALPKNSVIKILRGEREKSSFANFECFGAASNYSKNEINIVLQSLITKKHLFKTIGNNSYIEITNEGSNKIDGILTSVYKSDDYDNDLELYHKLREIRKKTSEKFLQTQYLLCPDELLKKIVKIKPKTKTSLLSIEGFSNRMFNKIGDNFLEEIKSEEKKDKPKQYGRDLPQNINETYNMLLKKYTLKEISQLRKLSEPVISMQIETILEYNQAIEIDYLFDSASIKRITDEITKGYSSLKEIKERLPSHISYAQIRIIIAKNKISLSL
ncbi:MAG: RecQ family ATP-dependent DNA helicase [Bacteroidetes bacterium]|nr:RecQ family ATP-dependent DNA helicase [Bacteroidota bacterium]